MKKFALLAAVAMVAACSQADTTNEVDTTEAGPEAVAEDAAPLAADGAPTAGNYKVTAADGSVSMEDVRADGTYSSTTDGGEPETGTWEQKSPELYCTTPDAEDAVQKCYTEAVDADGVWTSTDPDDGEVSTVERVEA